MNAELAYKNAGRSLDEARDLAYRDKVDSAVVMTEVAKAWMAIGDRNRPGVTG